MLAPFFERWNAETSPCHGWKFMVDHRIPSSPRAQLRRKFSNFELVNVAPDPTFSRLDRPYQGMTDPLEVFSGVLILRRITASHVPANQAHSQMYPAVANVHAVFAYVLVRSGELHFHQVIAF